MAPSATLTNAAQSDPVTTAAAGTLIEDSNFEVRRLEPSPTARPDLIFAAHLYHDSVMAIVRHCDGPAPRRARVNRPVRARV